MADNPSDVAQLDQSVAWFEEALDDMVTEARCDVLPIGHVRACGSLAKSLQRIPHYELASMLAVAVIRLAEQETDHADEPMTGEPDFQTADDAKAWLRSIVVPVYGDVRAVRGLIWATSEIVHPSRHGGDRTLWDRFEAARRLLAEEAGP